MLFLRGKQVWALPLAGGDAEQLTALPHGVSAFALSPDGKRLALAAGAPETRFAVGPLPTEAEPLARVIDRVDWRLDGDGYLDRHTHLFVQDGARRRASAARDARATGRSRASAWSPDGKRLAFTRGSARSAPTSLPRPPSTPWPRSGGEPVELARLAGSCSAVAWSPDGEHIAFLGIDEAGEPYGCEASLWVVPAAGGRGAARSRAGTAISIWPCCTAPTSSTTTSTAAAA